MCPYLLAMRRGFALGLVTVLMSVALGACGSTPAEAPGTASVVSAPVRIARTSLGTVGYRVVGSGPPLVLITGYGWTMEDWDPRLVHALAQHNRVVMFDNSGVGHTQELPQPFSIDAMADQTSALIDTLGLGRPDVLGWSMGGMIAQALAILHPAQVRRLVLCATYPGTGQAVVPSPTAKLASSDFPANQASALDAFKAAISEYPAAPPASPGTKGIQDLAMSDWGVGNDTAGREAARISAPALIADGTDDQLVPVANDRILAHLIPGAMLALYPDAGHAFLFQERITSLRDSLDLGECRIYLGNKIVAGYIVVKPAHFFDRDFIDLLMVDPAYRRSGIGRILLQDALATAGTAQVFTSTNTSNAPMRALLGAENWAFSGELDGLDEGDPELVFYKHRPQRLTCSL